MNHMYTDAHKGHTAFLLGSLSNDDGDGHESVT